MLEKSKIETSSKAKKSEKTKKEEKEETTKFSSQEKIKTQKNPWHILCSFDQRGFYSRVSAQKNKVRWSPKGEPNPKKANHLKKWDAKPLA
jgi:hypothetical protein